MRNFLSAAGVSLSRSGKAVTLVRILLGLFFIFSGLAKFWSLSSFAEVLYDYAFLPEIFVLILSYVIPTAEILLGAFLLMGHYISQTSFMLLVVFSFTVAAFWQYQNGVGADFGCFGSLIERKNDGRLFVENTLLICLLGFVFYREKGYTT